jgi:hypothetical protein
MNDEPAVLSMTENELTADTCYQQLLSRISETYITSLIQKMRQRRTF